MMNKIIIIVFKEVILWVFFTDETVRNYEINGENDHKNNVRMFDRSKLYHRRIRVYVRIKLIPNKLITANVTLYTQSHFDNQ